jgi:hypothetical protein
MVYLTQWEFEQFEKPKSNPFGCVIFDTQAQLCKDEMNSIFHPFMDELWDLITRIGNLGKHITTVAMIGVLDETLHK